MSIIGSNILAGSAGQGGGYTIERSLRLRSSASAYLSRTPASAGNRKTWTWSGWVKRGILSADQYLFEGRSTDTNRTFFRISGNNTLIFSLTSGDWLETSAVFRDPSAWYHIVYVFDTTQATQSNRVKLYVNGVQQTITATYGTGWPTQNADYYVNGATGHRIGAWNGGVYFDGYLTEVNFIDGFALTPSDFGNYNEDTGVWQPAKYAGSYGTNGFYLPFSDNTTTTTLAADASGNGNDWTPNNISLTSGATYDSMTDTPTPYADGGNYATWNPLDVNLSLASISNGNLTASGTGSQWAVPTIQFPLSGNYYVEFTVSASTDTSAWTGIRMPSGSTYLIYLRNGQIQNQSGTLTTVSTYGASDVIGISANCLTGDVIFYKNGTQVYSGNTTIPSSVLIVYCSNTTWDANFGQRPFAYTPPTGFKALHTGNLPDSAIVDGGEYFNAVTYSGQSTDKSVTGVGFQPDLTWIKRRDGADSHVLADAVRGSFGAGFYSLFTNLTNAESTSLQVQTLDADGFTVDGDTSASNRAGQTYVAWNWKANGAGVSNTDGSITSTVSANPTSGFSIVTYTGTGATATVGHGLGAAPSMIIIKDSTNGTKNWTCYHQSMGNDRSIFLNLTNEQTLSTDHWQYTTPSSSVFYIGDYSHINTNSDNYVAYCFADVEGYSKFGSYTGNGSSDGPFVYTGFRPAFVMVKRYSSGAGTANWVVLDTSRDIYNLAGQALMPNLSNAEYTPASSGYPMDILSNGFKQRGTSVSQNESGSTYIYMVFAENPFKNSLAR